MKKVMSLFLALLMVMSLAACGAPQADSTSPNAESALPASEEPAAGGDVNTGEERVITWMTVRTGWPVMEQIIDEYTAENPHVSFEFDAIGDRSNYYQKIKILAASNELPDLFDSDADTTLAEIASTGALADVDDLYNELGYDRVIPIGSNYARLPNGELYTLAWENNLEYFWYNKELFAQAGIEKEPETMDELLDVCEKLSAAGVTAISTFPSWHALRWLSFIPYRLAGNDFIEQLKVGDASMADPIGIQAAEFFQTVGMNYFQPGWATSDYNAALELFLSGGAGIYTIGSWQFGSFLDENREIKDEYGYFHLPMMEGAVNDETCMVAHAGTGTSISKDKLDDQLKHFLSFLLEKYPEVAFYEYNMMPAATFDTTLGTFSSFDQQMMDDSENMKDYAFTWDVRLDSATTEVVYKEMANLGMGAITPEEFAKRIDESIAENAPKFFG